MYSELDSNACLLSVGFAMISGYGVPEACGVAPWQIPQGHPAWAGKSGGGSGVEEARRARAAVQPSGEDHQGCRGEPQDQRVHFVASREGAVMPFMNLLII